MMKKLIGIPLLSAGIGLSTSLLSDEKAHWSYAGPKGPEYWGELDPQRLPSALLEKISHPLI